MNQAAISQQKTLEDILERLDKLAKELKVIKERLAESEPPYGSEAWWQWSEKQASKEIATGKVVKFDSVEEAIKWLNS